MFSSLSQACGMVADLFRHPDREAAIVSRKTMKRERITHLISTKKFWGSDRATEPNVSFSEFFGG